MRPHLALALVLAALAACSDDSDDKKPQACAPGQQIECSCPGGTKGGQACKADGSGYEACQCGAAGAGGGTGGSKFCTPNAEAFCTCSSGAQGTQRCRDDGSAFDVCQCGAAGAAGSGGAAGPGPGCVYHKGADIFCLSDGITDKNVPYRDCESTPQGCYAVTAPGSEGQNYFCCEE